MNFKLDNCRKQDDEWCHEAYNGSDGKNGVLKFEKAKDIGLDKVRKTSCGTADRLGQLM